MTDYSRIYVDTAPYIYYLEKNPQYAETVNEIFSNPPSEMGEQAKP